MICLKRTLILLMMLALSAASALDSEAQTESELALIPKHVFENPPIWRLTKGVAQSLWDVSLFGNPVSESQGYIMTPSYDLWSAVSCHLDRDWDRIVYMECMDNWIRSYATHGSTGCQLLSPNSIDLIAPSNDEYYSYYYYAYITDSENDRIVRPRFDWQAQVWTCDPAITGGGLDYPGDLDINNGSDFWPHSNDFLWVISGRSQLKRFLCDGTLMSTFGTQGCDGVTGTFCRLGAVVSGRSAFIQDGDPYASNDHLYVADVGNQRVVWLIKWHGAEGMSWMSEVPISSPIVDLEVDNWGQLWVMEWSTNKITKYSYDLFPLCTYVAGPGGQGTLCHPVSISNTGGYLGCANMFVGERWSDTTGGRYFAEGTDVVDFSATTTPDGQWLQVDYVLIDPSDVSVKIYNSLGAQVKSLFDGMQFSGPCTFVWNGISDSGQPCLAGDYRVRVVDTSAVWDIETGTPVNVVVKGQWFHYSGSAYCCRLRADINHDGTGPDVSDLTYLVNYMFKSGPEPPCLEEADVNGLDGGPDIADQVYLVNYMFKDGPPPPPCD